MSAEELYVQLNKLAGHKITIETPHGHLRNCEVIDCFDGLLRVRMKEWSEVGIPLAQVLEFKP